MSPLATPALHRALDQTLRFGPGYPSPAGLTLSNHLPMVLTALQRLGAPQAALDRHIALWAPRLVEQAAPSAPAAAPLAERLPHLLEAPETSAFHGAIRLAYALESGHAGEIGQALAAWEGQWLSLGPVPAQGNGTLNTPLPDLLAALRDDPGLAMCPRTGTTITSDLRLAVALPGFAAAVQRAQPTLDALAEAALAVYLATHDFTALHGVTGAHALRVLLAQSGVDASLRAVALRRFWRAWLAAWVSIGRPAPDWAGVHAGAAGEADWEAALPPLFTQGTDHAIKLADSAREEWRLRGWPGYARCLPGAAR